MPDVPRSIGRASCRRHSFTGTAPGICRSDHHASTASVRRQSARTNGATEILDLAGLVMLCSAVGLVVLLAILYTFVLPKGATTAHRCPDRVAESTRAGRVGDTRASACEVHPSDRYPSDARPYG
jgi:hypothetical protein